MSHFGIPLTVALLTYNRLGYLKESINAIINQSYSNFELLVLDNCSNDGTSEFVLSLKDSRIRYIRNAPNTTVQFNCVSAYHIASGNRVIATHDDDIMENDMLQRQMDFLDSNPDIRLVWTQISDIDQDGNTINNSCPENSIDRVFGPGDYIASFLRERLWPMPSGVMFERKLLPSNYTDRFYFGTKRPNKAKNPMDEAGIEDVLLPAQINCKHSIGFIATPLLRRRLHTRQFSHIASLSTPGVHLYQRLKEISNRIHGLKTPNKAFETHIKRFEIQELITSIESKKIPASTQQKINKTSIELTSKLAELPDCFLAGLPILILNSLLKNKSEFTVPDTLVANTYNTATRKLLAWAKTSPKASSILSRFKENRIIIFGSAFIAALLVIESNNHKLPILACIDSNLNRQNRKLLGTPIYSPEWMKNNIDANDVIIISSERDHEHYIETIIRQNLTQETTIISWKKLIG
jgi:glycosyltransferase involved in cell wall biosynthesis